MRPTIFLKTYVKAELYCTFQNACVFQGFFFSIFRHFSQAPKTIKINIFHYAIILKKGYKVYFMQSQLVKLKAKVTF